MNNKVLIVDDDPGIRETISQMIEGLGYAPKSASDGFDALAMLESGPFFCVFTDIMMPKMTGLELIKRIKAREISLPIIVITGYASLEIAIDAMKCGASDFIAKPFKVSQIQLLLNKVRREKLLIEENRKYSDTIELHRLIDNLAGQLDDKNREITSLQAISERIISLRGIRDLVSAIIDVTKQLLEDVDVQFFPLNRKTLKLLNPSGGEDRLISSELLEGKIFRRDTASENSHRRFETIFPLIIEGQVFGTLDVHSNTMLGEEKEHKILYLLNRSAERMENVALYEGLYENMLSTLNSMAKILDARDPHTSQHSTRVTNFSLAMGNILKLTEDEKDVLYIAASLHDIGKVGIPDSILLKNGRLTDDEFRVIKRHPDIGADILKPLPPMIRETDIIRYHHERYDGKGYPSGIGGQEIPLLSRIITLADSYDAMTSDRPYRDGLPVDKAIEEILRCTGSQFDPELAEIFIRNVIKP